MCSTPKEILLCEQTGLQVYIAYEVRISCKGPLRAALYVYCYLENNFYVFQTAPVVVYPSDVSIDYVIAPVSLTE